MPSVAFYIPSGMMRKAQKEIHYCSIQFNNVNLYVVLYENMEEKNAHLFYKDKIIFLIKISDITKKQLKMDGKNNC